MRMNINHAKKAGIIVREYKICLLYTSGAVISVGGGLPLREENRELLKKLGLVVYLDVSPETVYKRIGADVSSRPMLHSDDVPARIRSLLD